MVKDEESVVNDAIQFWKGFEDALIWVKKINDFNKVDEQLEKTHEMVELYKERLHEIRKRKKNARNNRRD